MLPSKLQKPTMSIDEVNHEGGVFSCVWVTTKYYSPKTGEMPGILSYYFLFNAN